MTDASLDIQLDAFLVTYVGTADTLRGIDASIQSRIEIFSIEAPSRREAIDVAKPIAKGALKRLGVRGQVQFEPCALILLIYLNPREMTLTVEKVLRAAVTAESDLEMPCAQPTLMH